MKPVRIFGLELRITPTKQWFWSEVDAGTAMRIATVNPEFILNALVDTEATKALEKMTHCVIDGTGMMIACNVLHVIRPDIPWVERIPGADIVEQFCTKNYSKPTTILFAGDESAPIAAKKLQEQAGEGVTIESLVLGKIDETLPRLSKEEIAVITQLNPTILCLGLGNPKQERIIAEQLAELPIQIMIGVGGTFQFYHDRPRAPHALRTLGLEWLYRGATVEGHAKRSKRAFFDFVWLAIKETFRPR